MGGELGLEFKWTGSTNMATIFSQKSYFTVAIDRETEENKRWRTRIEPVNLNIQHPGKPPHYVVHLSNVHDLDIRWDLFPGFACQAIVECPTISDGYDSLTVEIRDPENDPNRKTPMQVSFTLPRNNPPTLLEIWATYWNGTMWQRSKFRADIRQPIQLDMNMGILTIHIQHLEDFYRIVLAGSSKDR